MDLRLRWSHSRPEGLTVGYGHVGLHGSKVLGQWFALDKETGALLWERGAVGFNHVSGVCDGVIIASELRSGGPWTASFGIFALSIANGELLWADRTAVRHEGWMKIFDWLPFVAKNRLDSPQKVADGLVWTEMGRCLDVHSGKALDAALPDPPEDVPSLAHQLYFDGELALGELTLKPGGYGDGFHIEALDGGGQRRWASLAEQEQGFVRSHYLSYRSHKGKLFVVVGDGPEHVPIDPQEPSFVKQNAVNHHMIIIDAVTGQRWRVDLSPEDAAEGCRIEDIQDDMVLISRGGTLLKAYDIVWS